MTPLYQFKAARSVLGSLKSAVYSEIISGLKLSEFAGPPQKPGTRLANFSSAVPCTLANR
jgi:hypothetical protein